MVKEIQKVTVEDIEKFRKEKLFSAPSVSVQVYSQLAVPKEGPLQTHAAAAAAQQQRQLLLQQLQQQQFEQQLEQQLQPQLQQKLAQQQQHVLM
ncbi:hypothetical protein EBH_0067630 [Eimeria brunetti]|uniref:Uncharacterized protein n=1 Tax=Eimeria brunetti TaxID=51314 RepID=U6LDL1_9EIME|nr:hypothetical protein EBH_0067630 [Eimeria brunetti]